MADRAREFGEIYARHARDVFRFALSLSGDRDDAEDVTSEAFVRAYASRQPIRTETVRAYLFTIARHYWLETLRRRRPQVPLDESLPSSGGNPTATTEHASQLDAVDARLVRLPEIDRTALVLRAVHELPYAEIARVLGISEVAAKVKVHRARRALADLR